VNHSNSHSLARSPFSLTLLSKQSLELAVKELEAAISAKSRAEAQLSGLQSKHADLQVVPAGLILGQMSARARLIWLNHLAGRGQEHACGQAADGG
jgi:hypothetical protein